MSTTPPDSLPEATSPDGTSSAPSAAPATDRRPLILLVEDDADIRGLLAEVLVSGGYDVEEAENGRSALDRLQKRGRRPALMIIDLMMPEVNGWELLAALKESHADRHMGILVLSAISDSATPMPRVRWMRKPVQPDDLLLAVKATLEAR